MGLFTVIADYRGGTYIAQVSASNVKQALRKWADHLALPRGSFVGATTKSRLVDAARDAEEIPVKIDGTVNVWFWNPLNVRPTIEVHLIRTQH